MLPNTWISTMPIQKLGNDNPASAAVITTASAQPFGRRPGKRAEQRAEHAAEQQPAARQRQSVRRRCSPIILITGWRVVKLRAEITGGRTTQEVEILHQLTGRSNPRRWRSASITSWLAGVPPMEISDTGSPRGIRHGDKHQRPGQYQYRNDADHTADQPGTAHLIEAPAIGTAPDQESAAAHWP